MSGIAGVFYRDGRPVDPALLERLSARLAHRGGDGAGAWQSGSVGLVQRLFCTTPESRHERLPLSVARPAGAIVLTADARIDNRAELAGPLGLRDAADVPDSAFVLAAYETWGEACPEHLLGDFAFAIWDEPRQRLFVARDALGVKSLVYFDSPRLFAFASEVKALLCLPEITRAPNEAQIAGYLMHAQDNPRQSFFASVLRVRPGECLTVTPTATQAHVYWTIDLDRELRLPSDEDYAGAFRELFTEAVRCRLRSLTPLGAQLSGGLDSSSVVCMARQLLAGQPLHTFSILFDQTAESDERAYIREILAGGGLTPHDILGDRQTPLVDVDRILWHMEEPSRHLGICMQWLTFQAVQAQGLRLFLTGNGGDALVSYGLFRLAELTRAGQWGLLRRELQAFATARGRGLGWQARVWWEYGGRPLAPNWARHIRRTVRRWQRAQSQNNFVNAEFARRVERSRALPAHPVLPRTQREDHWLGLAHTAAIADHYDRAAQAWQTEQRHPLLDRRLAEFCLSLPSAQKFGQGQTRQVFRRAMRGVLPDSIRNRGSKSSPAYSLVQTILRDDRQRLDECLLGDTERLRSYVDLPAVQQAYRRVCAVPNPDLTIWPALTEMVQITLLSLWLKTNFEADEPAAAEPAGR